MTTTENTQTAVLAHHGIVAADATENQSTDAARDHGVLLACLDCGTVVVAPEGMTTEDYYAEQPWVREVIASGAWDCCEGDSIVF